MGSRYRSRVARLLPMLLFAALAIFPLTSSAASPKAAAVSGQGQQSANAGQQNPAPPPPPSAPKASTAAYTNKVKPGSSSAGPSAAAALSAAKSGTALNATATAKTLVLYDTTNTYGFLGELYAIGATNLSSHFGSWTAHPVSAYTAGEINNYTAVIYQGSTYDEPLPAAFLDDVLASTKPVLWAYDNIWQLANRNVTTFQTKYGWNAANSFFDASSMNAVTPVSSVQYNGQTLTRDGVNNLSGILNPTITNAAIVQVLASAVRSDNTTFPWAIRSGNLTYVGEIPFAYIKEEDRYIAFADLLFDLYGQTGQRHRAMVRLEDIDPNADPTQLRAIADYLSSQGVPFGFGVIPLYKDPLGYYTGTNCTPGVQCGPAETIRLNQSPDVVSALKYMISKGGTLVDHGYTHQFDGGINPYNEVTGDDFEFFRTIENADHTLTYSGPVPGDSTNWANGRFNSAKQLFTQVGLTPTIFEFPHYAASAVDYAVAKAQYTTRWERSLYFNGLLTGAAVSYTHIFGQFFPYAVRDVYGSVVLPENLGNIEPVPFFQFPTRSAAQLVNAAKLNLAVRDGIASFYFHPFWFNNDNGTPTTYLQDTVAGIKALGYTFVTPTTVATAAPPAQAATPRTTISPAPTTGGTTTQDPGPAPAPPGRQQGTTSGPGPTSVGSGSATPDPIPAGR